MLTGAAATEGALKEAASGSRVLHLSTHAFFIAERCGREGGGDNPLLLSGLALAGAN